MDLFCLKHGLELFSHRDGVKEKRKMQDKTFDEEALNKLWDFMFIKISSHYDSYSSFWGNRVQEFIYGIYSEILQKPIDASFHIFGSPGDLYLNNYSYSELKKNWYGFNFHQRLDMLEIFVKSLSDYAITDDLNFLLRQLLIPYRINKQQMIIQIDNEEEYKAIEDATKEIPALEKAVKFLYNRKNPDYRNSIKESILALEEMCKSISGDNNFSNMLAIIEKQFNIHPSFIESIKKLYGFCSDEKWIRHSGNKESDVDFEEAKACLVSCSLMINYLKAKQVKMGNKDNENIDGGVIYI